MKSDDKQKKPTTRSTRAPRKTGRAAQTDASPALDDNVDRSALPVERAADQARFVDRDGLDGEIRRRAYEIYLSRGEDGGDQVADWLEAERMVRDASSPRNPSS
ncbi:MAG: DUF2934 domain-containing protein [Gemmatimonadales bacterium]